MEILKSGNTIRCNVAYSYEGVNKITLKITRVTGKNKPVHLGNSKMYIHGITNEGKKISIWAENIYNEEII